MRNGNEVEKLTPVPQADSSPFVQAFVRQREVTTSDSQERADRVGRARARSRTAALELQSALTELCSLGLHVTVRIEPGYEEGALSPSTYFVEIETA